MNSSFPNRWSLSPKLGVVGISTLWHFRLSLPIQMFIKVASSPRLSGIGMPSPILWSHPLKMQRIILLSSLLWWELGTNSLITGPGEWLSFRRFTSKLSWSWSLSSWPDCAQRQDMSRDVWRQIQMQWMTPSFFAACCALRAPQHVAVSPFGPLTQSEMSSAPSAETVFACLD